MSKVCRVSSLLSWGGEWVSSKSSARRTFQMWVQQPLARSHGCFLSIWSWASGSWFSVFHSSCCLLSRRLLLLPACLPALSHSALNAFIDIPTCSPAIVSVANRKYWSASSRYSFPAIICSSLIFSLAFFFRWKTFCLVEGTLCGWRCVATSLSLFPTRWYHVSHVFSSSSLPLNSLSWAWSF